ncbi:uncharacterized protein LKV04_008457 [Tautogolabrus adspersus]
MGLLKTQEAELTDSEIKTLTRQELNELFPGAEKLKLRRKLFEEIHKEVLQPEQAASRTKTKLMVVSKEHKIMDRMLPLQGGQLLGQLVATEDYDMIDSDEAQDCTGKYKMVVSGTTFGAHQQILDKLKDQVELTESSKNPQITILFCVISSRVGSDVEAAMAEVKGDKRVILVLMHHLREPGVTASVTTWGDKYDNIMLYDHVFYHETVKGLVKCRENYEAVSRIQDKLLEFFPRRRGHK